MSLIPPTRMNEQVFKGKKKAAVGGHKLLKKKADALKVRIVRSGRLSPKNRAVAQQQKHFS
jgi:vacuolar-type H+-ATPase subunit D/Vma8